MKEPTRVLAGMKVQKTDITILITVLAFVLSVLTAWFQFRPKSDELLMSKSSRVSFDDAVEIRPGASMLTNIGVKYNMLGPVTWNIILSNPSDHRISIIDVNSVRIDRSNLDGSGNSYVAYFGPNSENTIEKNFPFSIEANESKVFIIKLYIPIKLIENDNCLPLVILKRIDDCYNKKGFDIFGNKPIEEPIEMNVQGWKGTLVTTDTEAAPKYIIEITTARSQKIDFPISYYD